MVRSKWKFLSNFQDIKNVSFHSHSKIMIKKRSMPIFFFKNQVLYVYNGKYFLPINVNENMMYYKLGEFVFTRKKCVRSSKKKK